MAKIISADEWYGPLNYCRSRGKIGSLRHAPPSEPGPPQVEISKPWRYPLSDSKNCFSIGAGIFAFISSVFFIKLIEL